MKEVKQMRSRWLTIRLNKDEEEALFNFYKKTTSQSLSEYARAILLNKQVTVLYRNQTADEFLAEMILLKNELNAIGNNFNQAVKKLHNLQHIPEIKMWAELNETSKKLFFEKMKEIHSRLNEIHRQWSQR